MCPSSFRWSRPAKLCLRTLKVCTREFYKPKKQVRNFKHYQGFKKKKKSTWQYTNIPYCLVSSSVSIGSEREELIILICISGITIRFKFMNVIQSLFSFEKLGCRQVFNLHQLIVDVLYSHHKVCCQVQKEELGEPPLRSQVRQHYSTWLPVYGFPLAEPPNHSVPHRQLFIHYRSFWNILTWCCQKKKKNLFLVLSRLAGQLIS